MHPLIRNVQKTQLRRIPEIRTGYTVRVHQKVTEGNKERVQIFEGLVIKVGHGEGVEGTITVRKIASGVGVEKIFPIHSPNITKIEVKKKAKVRRAKLYYMRERSGKSARMKERHVTDAERATEEAKMDVMIEEAVKAQDKKKKTEREVTEGDSSGDTAPATVPASSETAKPSADDDSAGNEPASNEQVSEKPDEKEPEPKEADVSEKGAEKSAAEEKTD